MPCVGSIRAVPQLLTGKLGDRRDVPRSLKLRCPSSAVPTDSVTTTASYAPTVLGTPIIAGDGYVYLAYVNQNVTSVNQSNSFCQPRGGLDDEVNIASTVDTVLSLIRIGTDGNFSNIAVQSWESQTVSQSGYPYPSSSVTAGAAPYVPSVGQNRNDWSVQMITNADQGVVLGWSAILPGYCASQTGNVCNKQVATTTTYGFARTLGATLAYSGSTAPGVFPVLQAQDGSYYGADGNGDMIRFTQYGNTIWSVPNDSPQIATADGGVIGSSGITYDSNGNADCQIGLPIQSWTGSESGSA